MRKYPVRKFLGLLALYAVVIVGIFVLQFKAESVLNKTSGSLMISLAQTQGSEEQVKLKNQFQVSFPGLVISANDDSPVQIFDSDNPDVLRPLVLESFDEDYSDDKGVFRLNFTDGSSLVFQRSTVVVEEKDTDSLTIVANPISGDAISLPYKFVSTHRVEEFSNSRVILNSGNKLYALNAPYINENTLGFVTGKNIATFNAYSPTTKFEFVALSGLPSTDAALCNTNVKAFRDALIARFNNPSSDESDYSEEEVVAYVAEMASRGDINDGINKISRSFKEGSRRTYFSVPYFGRLAALDRTLNLEVERLSSMVNTAVSSKNLDVFTVSSINDYIMREKKKSGAENLLSFPAQLYAENPDGFNPTVAQITGLLSVYTELSLLDSNKAALLGPVMDPCMERLLSHCALVDDRLVISENDVEISREQQILLGQTLLTLGTRIQRNDYADAGRVLLNQSLVDVSTLNLQTLAQLYPVLVKENKYYPHCQILGYYGNEAVWAWTCANNVTYSIGSEGVVSVNMEFPLERVHYIYLKGVPSFHSKIEIQQVMFRSAPDFETYNSSGYVYEGDTKSLYLKSRHKSRVELVRLWCDPASNFSKN